METGKRETRYAQKDRDNEIGDMNSRFETRGGRNKVMGHRG